METGNQLKKDVHDPKKKHCMMQVREQYCNIITKREARNRKKA